MQLIFDEKTYDIKNFSFSLESALNEDGTHYFLRKRIYCNLNRNINVDLFIQSLDQNFSGDIEIQLNDKTLHFSNYTLDSFNITLDDDREEFNISFYQENK